jgi:hypothetical protein
MKSEEIYNLNFKSIPVPFNKIAFGANDVIQTRRTREMLFYPFFAVPFFDMQPSTLIIYNETYNFIDITNAASCLISIAKRGGGYHFLDYPLTSFMKTFQIHKSLYFDLECDFNNSYVYFTQVIVNALPFVIPFVFRLYEEH